MVMGLLIDQNGIPIDYELFPGNTSEFSTMLPCFANSRTRTTSSGWWLPRIAA